MNKLANLGMMTVLLLGTFSVNGQAQLSKSALKQNALNICVQAVESKNGSNSIVSVRKQVGWKRPVSRLNWNDGLSAQVRMVVRTDDNQLARAICSVDQHAKVTLKTLDSKAWSSQGLMAITR